MTPYDSKRGKRRVSHGRIEKDRARDHSHRLGRCARNTGDLKKVGCRCHPRLRRHRLPAAAQGCRRQDLLHLLYHPQGQRMGKGKPGRGTAVLHHDRLLHRPRQHRDHPADEGHQPGADAGEHQRRHHPLVGGHGSNHRSARAAGAVELRRRQCDRTGRTVP